LALGFDRTLEAAAEAGLVPEIKTVTKVLVTIYDQNTLVNSTATAQAVRENAITAELYPVVNAKLGKQFKYANQKGIPFVLVIGPDEASKGVVTLKNMATGEQKTDTLENLIPTSIMI
jgi:histidyl-tRNA synthetase